MRVLIAPNSFGESLTAAAAADAIAAGWRTAAPADTLDLAPLSDGGPGFLEVLAGPGAIRSTVRTTDPLGRPVEAGLLVRGQTAYLESAQACGLHLLGAAERDPERGTTAGVAALLEAALTTGAERVIVGLGGSGTSDGGEGMLDALSPAARARCARIDLVAATDVNNPLLGPDGASTVFGPQKGADTAAVGRLEERLTAYVQLTARSDRGHADLANRPGAGAGGGLGFALFTLGARHVAGFDVVRDALALRQRVAAVDLVLTGEGRYDFQSLRGKAPSGVAALAAADGLPCLVLAGQVVVGRREASAHGVAETYALVEHADPAAIAAAIEQAAELLTALAARVARSWSPRA